MFRRVVSTALIGTGLFAAFGFPISVYAATNGLVNDLDRVDGVEVVDRDLRTLTLLTGSGADPATITVRVAPIGDEPAADALRRALTNAGFSTTTTYTPVHEDDVGYHARSRGDSFDADLYRVIDDGGEAGTVTVGVSFFDTDSMLFAPFAAVFGGGLLWLGWFFRPHGPEHREARAEAVETIAAEI